MRTHLPLRLLIPALLVIASMTLPVRSAAAESRPAAGVTADLWVDAQAGNDANNGLSSSSAFRTIQAAAGIAGPGSTIHILPGVYRELVTPEYDGTGTARITYKAQNGPGTVKLRGSASSSSLTWTRLASNTIGLPTGVNPGNLYYADLSGWALKEAPRFVVQLNAQGDVTARLPVAREPDWQVTTAWKYGEFWWAADGGSSVPTCDPVTNTDHDCDVASRSTTQLTDRTSDSQPAGIQPGNLTTLGNLTGGTLVALDTYSGHYVYRRKIVAHNVAAGTVTVDPPCGFDSADNPGLGWGSKYYVENRPSLLDQPGEWWYDASTSRLYLWPLVSGTPATQNLEISRQSAGLQLGRRSYITIDGLTMEFFNGTAVVQATGSTSYSYNNIIRNATIRYANTGIDMSQGAEGPLSNVTDGFTLESSVVAHIDSQALRYEYWWSDGSAGTFTHSGITNTVIRNNEFYDLGFRSSADDAEGFVFQYADKLRFEGNYVHEVAHNGVAFERSLIQSSKVQGFSPDEIKIGQILIKDNIIEKTCLLATDCGALKFWGDAPDRHVFRDVLVTGNVFRNVLGWTYVAEMRSRRQVGRTSELKGMVGFGLYMDHVSGIHAYRNIAYNTSRCAIDVYANWWQGQIVLYNNIAANSSIGICLKGDTQSSLDTEVANNIVVNNETYGIGIDQPPAGYGNFVLDHNLYYNNGWRTYESGGLWKPGDMLRSGPDQYLQTLPAIQAATPWEVHGVEGDPSFTTYNVSDHNLWDNSWPDFHLTGSSTNAADRGTASLPPSLAALLTKFNIPNAMVGGAWDIGRFERAATNAPNVKVEIGSSVTSGYALASGESTRQAYSGTANGPVKITSTDGVTKLIAAKRSVWLQNGAFSSYSEMMGLPKEKLSSEYYFPWYNNVNPTLLDEQFRIASTQGATNVEISFGGVVQETYPLGASEVYMPSYLLDSGPVKIRSLDGKKLVVSLRAVWLKGGVGSSYGEIMGVPKEQLSSEYYFPWYNSANPTLLNEQLRFGNVDSVATHVEVSAGGTVLDTYLLQPGESRRQAYAIDSGPVKVRSLEGKKIIAAIRAVWLQGGQFSSYNELMGLPKEQLSTEYVLPWYNNVNPTLLDEQFRFGNVDTANANVEISANGAVLGSYTLTPGQSMRQAYPSVDNGVIRIRSTNGKKIIGAIRAVWLKDAVFNSYSELMGLPVGALSTEYWFPWYDNASSDLNEQLRFGRP